MGFKKLTREAYPTAGASSDVRIANYDGKQPRVLVPVSVLDQLGVHIGSRVDLMLDADVRPNLLAVVVPGKTVKILKAQVSGSLIMSSILRKAIPKMKTTIVHHEIGRIEGCVALIISLPILERHG